MSEKKSIINKPYQKNSDQKLNEDLDTNKESKEEAFEGEAPAKENFNEEAPAAKAPAEEKSNKDNPVKKPKKDFPLMKFLSITYFTLLFGYCLLFGYSLVYIYEADLSTKPQKLIELTEEEKLNQKIKKAESRIEEVKAAEQKLLDEQKKNEELKQEAINEQETANELYKKAENLFTEEKEKRFKKTITLITDLLIVLLLLTLSFTIYRMYVLRKKIDHGSIVIPEIVREDMEKISKKVSTLDTAEGEQLIKDEIIQSVDKLKKAFPESINYLSGFIKSLEEKADKNYTEGIKALQEQLRLKEDKISEIQELKLRERYIKEILDLSTMVKYFLKEKDSKELKNIDESIDKLLKNEDLKELNYEEGFPCEKLISKEHKVKDDIITDEKDKDGTVCETLKKGFYIESHEGKKIIVQKAEISIYKYILENVDKNNSNDIEVKDKKK